MNLGNFTVKNVVAGRGHDCGGLIADLYLNNKKVMTYHDDGWGGEAEYQFISDAARTQVLAEMKRIDVNGQMMADGWDEFSDKVVRECYQIDQVVSECAQVKESKKDEKKGIVIKEGHIISIIQWGGVTIPTFLKKCNRQKAIDAIQKAYNREIAKGKEILNKDYLQSIGINI